MKSSRIFTTQLSSLVAVIEVNADRLHALVCDIRKTSQHTPDTFSPVVIKKMAIPVSAASRTPLRIATLVRSFLFSIIKALERVPHRVVIALDPELAEEVFALWSMHPASALKHISYRELGVFFRNVVTQEEAHAEGSLFVFPVEVLINGYQLFSLSTTSRAGVGYSDAIPLPMGSPEISFRVIRSRISPEAGTILTEMKRSLGGLPIEFVPTPIVVGEALSHHMGCSDVLLIAVGRIETTIVLVGGGTVEGIVSFHYGHDQYVRALEQRYSGSAENLLLQYAAGVVHDTERSAIAEIISQHIVTWGMHLKEALEGLHPYGPIPSDIRLYGIGATLPELPDFLKTNKDLLTMIAVDSPTIRVLRAESLFSGSTMGGTLSGPRDVGLAALVLYTVYHRPLF